MKYIIGLLIIVLVLSSIPILAYETPVIVDPLGNYPTDYASQRNLVRLANDTILAVYTTWPDPISYAVSTNNGTTWSLKGPIYADDSIGYGGNPCIARDSHDRVWCAYTISFGEGGTMINITYYDHGVWAVPRILNISEMGELNPFICIDSSDLIDIVWEKFNDTYMLQVMEANFVYADFSSLPIDAIIVNQSSGEEIDQRNPSASFDGSDILHVVWEQTNGSTFDPMYCQRHHGDTTFQPAVDILPALDTWNYLKPTICVDPVTQVVYSVWIRDNWPLDNLVVIYGNPPDGSHWIDLTLGMFDDDTIPTSVSCGWFNDKLQIVYADYFNYTIAYVNGTPTGGWNLLGNITTDIPPGIRHEAPSIRWAYYHENVTDSVEYVFEDYNGTLLYQAIDLLPMNEGENGEDGETPDGTVVYLNDLGQNLMFLVILLVVGFMVIFLAKKMWESVADKKEL
jgi:hypothetical protein